MTNIQRLSGKNKEELVRVLASAFHEYAVMRFVLRTKDEEYERHLKALIGFFCEVRIPRNWPMLGIRNNGELIAAALINEPVAKPLPLPEDALSQLQKAIGKEAYDRLVHYEDQSSKAEPPNPHHFLGMIGVLPEYRGKGYAVQLMTEVKEMSIADPASSGVCLSTEDPKNVALYERFGFKIISEANVDELHSWCMFLPTK